MRDGAEVRIERVAITHPDAQLLVEEVQQEYVVRYGGRDDSPIEPGAFDPPRGAFFVAYRDGVAVATGAWRTSDVVALGSARTAEVKRMSVTPSARGLGLARRMLVHLETTAAAGGAEVLVLETGANQPEAIALYVSAGYEPVEGFGHYRDSPLSRCFGKRLGPLDPGADDPARTSVPRA